MFPIWIGHVSPVESWPWAIAYVALASLVTADVLLKKSDVRSALGWIGAVWLAPLIGALLYYMFGINRVTRRALRLARLDNRETTARNTPAEPEAPPNIHALAEVGRHLAPCSGRAGEKRHWMPCASTGAGRYRGTPASRWGPRR